MNCNVDPVSVFHIKVSLTSFWKYLGRASTTHMLVDEHYNKDAITELLPGVSTEAYVSRLVTLYYKPHTFIYI